MLPYYFCATYIICIFYYFIISSFSLYCQETISLLTVKNHESNINTELFLGNDFRYETLPNFLASQLVTGNDEVTRD